MNWNTPHSSAEQMANRLRELYRLKQIEHGSYASLYGAHLDAGLRLSTQSNRY